MLIREARPDDAAEWTRMRTALWPAPGHAGEIAAHFRGETQPTLAVCFVAVREEGGLAGFIEVGLREYAEGCESSPVPFIEGWYVDADARRQGLGAALVRHAEAWARQRGHTEIASDVELQNDASREAHRRLGYEEVARLVGFRRALG